MLQTPPRECYFLLAHPKEESVLLLHGSEGWALPHCSLPAHAEHERAQLARQMLYAQFEIDCFILHIDYRWQTPQSGNRQTFFTIENLLPDLPLPKNAVWVPLNTCATLELVIPEHRQVLETWWHEREVYDGVPWQYPGWFYTVTDWMAQQFDGLVILMVAPIEQLYTKFGACMLRVATTDGLAYLKAVPAGFAHEPHLMFWLDKHHPGSVPPVLAIDSEHSWLLTLDAGGQLLQMCEQIEPWERALREFAVLQIKCLGSLDELFTIGCVDLRLEQIAVLLESLLEDEKSLMLNKTGGLTSTEVEELHSFLPQMKQVCQRLASYSIPATLEHGDFNPMNILITDNSVVYLDWTDSTVTHPFFSALRLIHYFLTPALKAKYPDAPARLRQVYLEPWTPYAPMDQLLQAFQHAFLPMLMQRALFYSQLPFSQQGLAWERSTVVPNQLRTLLKYMRPLKNGINSERE